MRKTHASPTPGDIGDNGDIFRKAAKTLFFLPVHTGDIPGDIFRAGDLSRALAPETGERPETRGNVRRAPLRARYPCVRASLASRCASRCGQKRPYEAHSMGRTSGSCLARMEHASIAPGEPLPRTVRAPSVFRRPAPRPGSTYEAPTVSVLAKVRHFRTVAPGDGRARGGIRRKISIRQNIKLSDIFEALKKPLKINGLR